MTARDLNTSDQYNRYAEDWRFHHKLIWEIPSVTFAILGGLLTISYSFLGLLPRLIFLILGAAVVFGLTLAVLKHRFGANLRTNFLEEIGQDRIKFPVRTQEGIEYLRRKERKVENEKLIKLSSEKFLIAFMFLAFACILFLIFLTSWQLYDKLTFLANEGKELSQILNNITAK